MKAKWQIQSGAIVGRINYEAFDMTEYQQMRFYDSIMRAVTEKHDRIVNRMANANRIACGVRPRRA